MKPLFFYTLISLLLLSQQSLANSKLDRNNADPISSMFDNVIDGLYLGISLDYNKVDYNFTGFLANTDYRIDMGSFVTPSFFAEYSHILGKSAFSYCVGMSYAIGTKSSSQTIDISGNNIEIKSTLKQNTFSAPISLRYTFAATEDWHPYIGIGYQQDISNASTLTIDYPWDNSIDGVASRSSVFYSIGVMGWKRLSIRFRGYLKPNNAVEPIAGYKYGHRFNSLLQVAYRIK